MIEQLLDFIAQHGKSVVFWTVLLDQLGLPIPTIPFLLAFGALAGNGSIDPVTCLVLAVTACLCADFAWYQLGRWKGTRILGFLCSVSLEPDSCVSKTHDLFGRYGVKSLLVAKFIPGFDTVAPPLAGLLGVRPLSFLLWSAAGALTWLLAFGGVGFLFGDRIDELAEAADQFGSALGWGAATLLALYFTWKYVARQRVLRSIRMARITPDELHRLIVSGHSPVIIDARSRSALDALPFLIQGARLATVDTIDQDNADIPRAGEVVVYCSCPNEISSARLALKLRRLGIERVRPLAGGIEAWRALSFPVVPKQG